MNADLHRQTGIVVGASSGMGRATAIELARAGMHVVAAARRADRLDDLARLVDDMGGSLETVVADCTNPASVQSLVDQSLQKQDALTCWSMRRAQIFLIDR